MRVTGYYPLPTTAPLVHLCHYLQVPLTWATDAFMALAVIITLTSFSEARVDEPVRPR